MIFTKTFSISFIPENFYLIKMCLIFDDPQSKAHTRYQKILRGCSFVCKTLLNFACTTMKFPNRHYYGPLAFLVSKWGIQN